MRGQLLQQLALRSLERKHRDKVREKSNTNTRHYMAGHDNLICLRSLLAEFALR